MEHLRTLFRAQPIAGAESELFHSLDTANPCGQLGTQQSGVGGFVSQAADGCKLRTRGRTVALVSPRLVHDESRSGIRPLERAVLRLLGVADFLSAKTAP